MDSGAVVLNLCHTAPDDCHCTCPGVSCGAVADQFAFDSVLMVIEEETDEVDHGAFLGGRVCGWGCLVANE